MQRPPILHDSLCNNWKLAVWSRRYCRSTVPRNRWVDLVSVPFNFGKREQYPFQKLVLRGAWRMVGAGHIWVPQRTSSLLLATLQESVTKPQHIVCIWPRQHKPTYVDEYKDTVMRPDPQPVPIFSYKTRLLLFTASWYSKPELGINSPIPVNSGTIYSQTERKNGKRRKSCGKLDHMQVPITWKRKISWIRLSRRALSFKPEVEDYNRQNHYRHSFHVLYLRISPRRLGKITRALHGRKHR